MEFLDEYVQVRLTPTDKKKIKLNAWGKVLCLGNLL